MNIVNLASIDDVSLLRKLERAIGRTIAQLTEDELKLVKWKFYDKDECRFRDWFYIRRIERRLGRKLTLVELIQEELMNGIELVFPDGMRELVVIPRIHFPYDLLSKEALTVESNDHVSAFKRVQEF